MKRLIIILLLNYSWQVLRAQTFAEWFSQGKTQRKYLLQQIAALQVYAGYVEKGYAIAQSSLAAIHHIKKGDLTLHSDYFRSLQQVNPLIKNDTRVTGIEALDAQIKKVASTAVEQAKKSTKIAAPEKFYIAHVLQHVVQLSKANISLLIEIITPGQLELTDDERWKKIGELHEDMTEKYAFAKSFTAGVQRLIAERSAEGKDIENEKRFLGIK